jgi:hypothetical protein
MTPANINRFIQCLGAAFKDLGASVPMPQVELMAVLVHSAMENPRRRYHVSDHALYVCQGLSARQVLAAVFHDIVYYQLDNGFAPRLAGLLTPVVSQQGHDLVLLQPSTDAHATQLCLDLFGWQPGHILPPLGGMNEFLSASVAARLLQPYLAAADLIAVLASIEATIPFRPLQPDGQDCALALAERVRTQARRQLGLQAGPALEDFVTAVMRDAITLANRDVDGFAESDPGRFVSDTWLLIEESNVPLAAVGVYTLLDYREALSRMQVFLDSLVAARVFHHYDGIPEPRLLQHMTIAAAANIGFASVFLRLKITSIALMEALAHETGGDGPVSMFLGDIRCAQGQPQRIEHYLPAMADSDDLDQRLLRLLEQGRPQTSRNDLTVSPLTAYMYRCLRPEGCARALEQAQAVVQGSLTARAFLAALPQDMLDSIIVACAHIAVSRRARLLALKVELQNERLAR